MDSYTKSKLWTYGILLIILLFLSFPFDEIFENPNDYARITEMEYKAVVVDEPLNSGKVVITERITFDIHAASRDNLFWELWRDLPESYLDGLKIDYQVNSVKQIMEDGTEIVYLESPKLYWYDSDYTSSTYGPGKWYHSKGPYDGEYNFECVLFYVDGLYREEVVFEIEYEMNNAAFRYGDVSELYLSMFSGTDIKYLESFKAEILVQDSDMPKEGNYEFYTYGTNTHEFEYKESKNMNPGYHTFYIDLDKDDLVFKPYNQYLEFTLWAYGNDYHSFTDYAPVNNYYNEEVLKELRTGKEEYDNLPIVAKNNKIICFISSIVVALLIVWYGLSKDKKIRKNNKFYETNSILYYRDIPKDLDPYFISRFVFCKDKMPSDDTNGFSAVLLSLVRKGYIELVKKDLKVDWIPRNINIVMKYRRTQNINSNKQVLSVPKSVPSMQQTPTRVIIPTMAGDIDGSLKREYFGNYEDKKPVIYDSTGLLQNKTIDNTVILDNAVQEDLYNIDNKKLEPLTVGEKAYFNLISRHAIDFVVGMDYFQNKLELDYDNTDKFVKTVQDSFCDVGLDEDYLQSYGFDRPKKELKSTANLILFIGIFGTLLACCFSYHTRLDLAYGGYFIFGIILVILSIYLKHRAKKYILLTQLGEEEYAKWKGLYDFLNSNTLMNERTVIDITLWEKYLVYATAFGISEKIVKALEIRCPELSNSPMLNNRYYHSSNFRVNSRSIRTSTRTASSTSRAGGFSGGHYGGGGRGGGGGGGGH